MPKMSKKMSVDTIASILANFTLNPYNYLSGDASDEQKWVILSSICKSLSRSMPNNLLVENTPNGALFNFSALAEMNETMLAQFFKTPDTLYEGIKKIIFNGFKEYIEGTYFKNMYSIEDCE